MFALIKVGERSGMGLCDIYNYWKEYGYEKPVIKETINPDRITFTLNIEVEASEKSNDSNVTNVANVANVANDVANATTDVVNAYKLTDLDKEIYKFIVSHSNASTKEIAEAVRVTTRTVQRSVKELEKNQLIKRTGTRTKIEWIILK